MRQRSRLAKRRNRTHYDARVEGFDFVVVEPHPRDHPRREVLDQAIGLGDEFLDDRQPRRILHVDAQALLATILLYVVAATSVLYLRQVACAVATLRQFDLNYFRAHLRHHPSRRGSRDILGEVQHCVSTKDMRARLSLHAILVLCGGCGAAIVTIE
jgi:hypothetical protein